jgi:leucyl/phenylalanyl-tRNA--protein transferase
VASNGKDQPQRRVIIGGPDARRNRKPKWQNRVVIPWLGPDTPFPPLAAALDEPNGLLAASRDLSPRRLLEAYSRGIFPWYSGDQPVLWWSPDPRMVLFLDEFKVARSLRKRLRQGAVEIRADTSFRDVVESCAAVLRPGQTGTWITPGIVDAYTELHERGYAHSVEAWRDGELVGGLYGVGIGRMFFGESMFAIERDASKIALVHLVAILRRLGVPMIDCQQETGHLASFGARPIPREQFARRVAALVNSIEPGGMWTALTQPELLHDQAE